MLLEPKTVETDQATSIRAKNLGEQIRIFIVQTKPITKVPEFYYLPVSAKQLVIMI